MKRKRVHILVITGLIVALAFYSSYICSAKSKEIKIPKLLVSTGSVGGSWYATASSIGDWVNDKVEGYPITAVPGAGSIGNIPRVVRGETEIGMSLGAFLLAANKGNVPFNKKYPNIRAMFSLTANSNHFLVDEKFEATTLKDIVDKKIGLRMSTSFPGSADNVVFEQVFTALGTSIKEMGKWGVSLQLVGTSGRVNLWKDRHIDLLHSLIEFPAAAITDAMASRKGRLLGLTEPVRDTLIERYGFVKVKIPAGTYPGQDYPVPTVQAKQVFFTTEDFPEEIVYLIVKTVAESKERLRKAYKRFEYWEPKDMIKGLGIQIHEGALKYYKEQGWI